MSSPQGASAFDVSVDAGSYRVSRPDSPQQVIELLREHKIQIVDLKFTDLPGLWQHFSITLPEVHEDLFANGIGFDGSSIRGFQEIQESDMLLKPDPTTAFIDPVSETPTLSMICDVIDPVLHRPYSRDPRYIARKAEEYLKQTGIATTCYFGPELEFFIFDSIRFGQDAHCGYYYVESAEGDWNTGRDEGAYGGGNLGYKPRYKEGYFPVPPHDTLQDIRSTIVLLLQQAGVQVEVHHHEVATAGQNEIDMRFSTLTRMADNVMIYKYICKNVARQHGKVATFMPKPLFADNASGMHCHQKPVEGQRESVLRRKWLGAHVSHVSLVHRRPAQACAGADGVLCSYKRLVPGYEAPVNLAMSQRNRRIGVHRNARGRRLDGVENRTDPGDPLDVNIYDLPPEKARSVRQVPGSLDESLKALEADNEFLRRGDVFTEDVIDTWLEYKRKREIDAVRLRPHPWEFYLYFDI